MSVHGYHFYVLFVDDFSRFTWIYPLKHKSEKVNVFRVFKAYVENKFNTKIKTLQCDNGGEFRPIVPLCQESGIEVRYTCPYTSEQNGRVKRKHRHVVEMGLTLLAQAKLPLTYWFEAFQMAVFIINRLPTPVINHSTPLFQLLKEEPNYKDLQAFGCACFPCLKPYNQHKFQYHSKKIVYLGPAPQHKGHRCLSFTGRIYISRHVIFDSSVFPCADGFLNKNVASTGNECIIPFPIRNVPINSGPSSLLPAAPTDILSESDGSRQQDRTIGSHASDGSQVRTPICSSLPRALNFVSPARDSPQVSQPTSSPSSIGIINSQAQPMQHAMITRAKAGVYKPKVPYIGLIEEKPSADCLLRIEPRNVTEALSSSCWRTAMEAEFQALQKNNTWVLVPASNTQKLVDSKWVFKIKYNTDGTIFKHKARLVAKGFQQTPGIDFGETFSPVIKATTVRLVLTLAVKFGWQVRQMDVNNTFLNGYLQEHVFMRQPEGFRDSQRPNHVCKLVKALYGLKQAQRAWFDRLKETLIEWGFQNSKSDVFLFFLKTATLTIFVLVYVDDILVTGNNSVYISEFVHKLNTLFALKDLGSLSYFLGIEASRSSAGIHLTQEKYVNDILQKFNMSLRFGPYPNGYR